MLETIKDKNINKSEKLHDSFFNNYMIIDFYNNYYNELNSRQLDKEFNHDLSILVKSLHKLPQNERKEFIKLLSKVVEFYIENKIEKELDKSLYRIFKVL